MARILTTHVGSLPRSQRVADLLFARERGEELDQPAYDSVMRAETIDVLRRQRDTGIDIPSDGETSKISYATYIKDRLTGFEGDSPRRAPADLRDFPSFLERLAKAGGTPSYRRPCCTGPIAVKDMAPVRLDLTVMRAAMDAAGYAHGFMNSASPGVIALFQPSTFHRDLDSYMEDVAEGMRHEYEAIVAAGLILQIDAPDLGLGRHMMYAESSEAEFIRRAEIHVEILNYALRNVPADRVRMHICWGN
ncbi:MAG: epoxyalkane--coenzyme M transferase, partial [Rubritepida sp.]|nr:epoxyalkane--coenzyme M transferase [Rubritepida sp.]